MILRPVGRIWLSHSAWRLSTSSVLEENLQGVCAVGMLYHVCALVKTWAHFDSSHAILEQEIGQIACYACVGLSSTEQCLLCIRES
jgi:hypothetical protein